MTASRLLTLPQNAKRILAVSTGGLGDTILFSPVLKALRSRYPEADIELLLANGLAERIYSSSARRTTLLHINHRPFPMKATELIRFACKTRSRGGFDLGVFATGLNSTLSSFLKLVGVIRYLACAPGPPAYKTDLLCNVALAHHFDADITEKDTFVPLTNESLQEVEHALEKHEISPHEKRLIAVYPSTELPHRPRWELPKLLKVLSKIRISGFTGKFVAIGSSAEGKELSKIDNDGIIDANLAGELSISGSCAVFNRCLLALGNEGGLMHVAGAMECPLIVVATNVPLSYRPPGKKVKVIHSNFSCCEGLFPKRPSSCKVAKCKDDITISGVYQACIDLLSPRVLLS